MEEYKYLLQATPQEYESLAGTINKLQILEKIEETSKIKISLKYSIGFCQVVIQSGAEKKIVYNDSGLNQLEKLVVERVYAIVENSLKALRKHQQQN